MTKHIMKFFAVVRRALFIVRVEEEIYGKVFRQHPKEADHG
jgi:hypothetical protein